MEKKKEEHVRIMSCNPHAYVLHTHPSYNCRILPPLRRTSERHSPHPCVACRATLRSHESHAHILGKVQGFTPLPHIDVAPQWVEDYQVHRYIPRDHTLPAPVRSASPRGMGVDPLPGNVPRSTAKRSTVRSVPAAAPRLTVGGGRCSAPTSVGIAAALPALRRVVARSLALFLILDPCPPS